MDSWVGPCLRLPSSGKYKWQKLLPEVLELVDQKYFLIFRFESIYLDSDQRFVDFLKVFLFKKTALSIISKMWYRAKNVPANA
jgi:hypothetical protein